MTKREAVEAIQAAMPEKGLTFAELAAELGYPRVDRVRITLDGKFLPYQWG